MTTPEALRDNLLAGRAPTPEGIDAFIVDHAAEGPTHDFKDGALLGDKKKRNFELRRHITGFANGDGGVLIIGVNERERGSDDPRHFTGTRKNIGKAPIAEWAADTLADLAGYFSPQPRATVVPHPAGDVLLVATGRAPRLVPLAEERQRLKFWMRIGHCTVEVPDYLLSDLVLGRRSGPSLHLELDAHELSFRQGAHAELALTFRVENRTFTRATFVELGAIYWCQSASTPISPFLEGHIETRRPPFATTLALEHLREPRPGQTPHHLNAFETRRMALRLDRLCLIGSVVKIMAAIHVTAENTAPIWCQLAGTFHAATAANLAEIRQLNDPALTAVAPERPIVAFEPP